MSDVIKLGEKYSVEIINFKVEVPLESGKKVVRTIKMTMKDLKKIFDLSKDEEALNVHLKRDVLKLPIDDDLEDSELLLGELAEVIVEKYKEYEESEKSPSN